VTLPLRPLMVFCDTPALDRSASELYNPATHGSVNRLSPVSHMRVKRRISSPYWDADSHRCVTSLPSELSLIRALLTISKRCLSPKLKTHALELHERKVKLKQELKIRSEEENLWSTHEGRAGSFSAAQPSRFEFKG
jgi:hypothetical protein